MSKQKRKSARTLRLSFKCKLAPSTQELITGIQNETKESQGEIIDRAIAMLALGEEVNPKVRKQPTKREAAIADRAASDVVAQAVERTDIDYSDVDSTPTTHVARMARNPKGECQISERKLSDWRASRRPLLKPKDR